MSVGADPDALRRYRDTGVSINSAVRADATYLGSRLERLATSGSELLPPIPALDAALRGYADQADGIDGWVGEIGDAVAEADSGGGFFSRAWGSIKSFGRGAWDGIAEPAKMVWSLRPFHDGTGQAWSDLGSGLWYGVTNPLEFGKGLIGWEYLSQGEYAYWAGNLLPGAAATVFTGGGAAAVRGASTTSRLTVATDRFTSGTAATTRLTERTATLGRYNPATTAGPLANVPRGMTEVIPSFRSGTYTHSVTTQPTVLYRVHNVGGNNLGPYWTPVRPHGPTQSILDSALLPEWGNRAMQTSVIRVPAGQEIFTGIAAPQIGPRIGSQLTGGGPQVFIPRVDERWLVTPLTPAERLFVGGTAVTAGGGMRLPEALPDPVGQPADPSGPR